MSSQRRRREQGHDEYWPVFCPKLPSNIKHESFVSSSQSHCPLCSFRNPDVQRPQSASNVSTARSTDAGSQQKADTIDLTHDDDEDEDHQGALFVDTPKKPSTFDRVLGRTNAQLERNRQVIRQRPQQRPVPDAGDPPLSQRGIPPPRGKVDPMKRLHLAVQMYSGRLVSNSDNGDTQGRVEKWNRVGMHL